MPTTHYHDAYEILYLVSGELYYFIEDRTYQIVGGVILFINVYDLHRLVNVHNTKYERVTLLFKREFLHDLFVDSSLPPGVLSCFQSETNTIKLNGPDQIFIENLFSKMIHEDTQKPPGYDVYRKLLLMELLIFIQRKNLSGHHEHLVQPNRTHKKISQITHFINGNFTKPLSLEYMADKFSISSSHLSRTFKDTTGFTFIEYVNNTRLKAARSLLQDSTLTVSEIAEHTGFGNLTHFGRVFKAMTGTSPLKYRKQYLANGAFNSPQN
ncbi:helix-turn-helix domain-containing protein [Paenibacillus sp. NPDC056722]|uniref:helix-turn-helix domain-containing protein n=1 Tax=Paenibacillus sp. NPDC056722 TaxID=3345924 RepID=UPI003698ED84